MLVKFTVFEFHKVSGDLTDRRTDLWIDPKRIKALQNARPEDKEKLLKYGWDGKEDLVVMYTESLAPVLQGAESHTVAVQGFHANPNVSYIVVYGTVNEIVNRINEYDRLLP